MRPTDIETWTGDQEVIKLQELAEGKTVLELGTWMGHTAIAMAQDAKLVVTVDTHEGDRDTKAMKGEVDTYRILMDNIKKYEAINVLPVIAETYKALMLFAAMDAHFDMAFIDANHDYNWVKSDSELVYPLIKKGGIIAWHDYPHGPVKTAVDETVKDNNMQLVVHLDRLIAYKK